MSVDGLDVQKRVVEGRDGHANRLLAAFPRLTVKQHEAMQLVAENRTSKEIAWELGVSESAVNQRIEGVRNRTGYPPRAELARAYRQYLRNLDQNPDVPDLGVEPVANAGLPDEVNADSCRASPASDPALIANSAEQKREGHVVPQPPAGARAEISRKAAAMVVAAAVLVVAMFGIGVVHMLSDMH